MEIDREMRHLVSRPKRLPKPVSIQVPLNYLLLRDSIQPRLQKRELSSGHNALARIHLEIRSWLPLSGNQKLHSTETALVYVTDNLLQAMDDKKNVRCRPTRYVKGLW